MTAISTMAQIGLGTNPRTRKTDSPTGGSRNKRRARKSSTDCQCSVIHRAKVVRSLTVNCISVRSGSGSGDSISVLHLVEMLDHI